jgi:RNA polymerase sigma factor (sigma-70 family)
VDSDPDESQMVDDSYVDMWSLSDETLLAGLGSEDPEVATAFVRRFQGRVFGLAVTILGDSTAAEEAAQETFVRAWQHAEAYDPRRGAVSTWLLTIARNVSIDMARMRRIEPMDPEVLLAIQGASESGDDPIVEADEILRLKRALGELPKEQQRALVLAAFYGRTAREIGEMEGAPIGTIKTRIRTALLKLKAMFEVNDDR